jgi:hypothetical protein
MAVKRPEVQYDGREHVDSHGAHVPVRIILHDTESHDVAGIKDLRGIAEFWDRQNEGYGAHIGIDKEGNTARYVRDKEIAWHTGGRNTGSLGIELIGFARFGFAGWRVRRRQLDKAARWLAFWSQEYDIPLRPDVERGVSTHRAQSLAFRTSTHTDPGLGFPLGSVLRKAKRIKRRAR